MRIVHVPIETNASRRPSRLHRGMLSFLWHQGGAILRSYTLYQPLRTFSLLGIPFLLIGIALLGRFLILHFLGQSGVARHIQSVTIGGALLVFGLLLLSLGLLADALRANRQTMEEILTQLRDQAFHPDFMPPDMLGSVLRSRQARGDAEPAQKLQRDAESRD
jgi:hypothetical protein